MDRTDEWRAQLRKLAQVRVNNMTVAEKRRIAWDKLTRPLLARVLTRATVELKEAGIDVEVTERGTGARGNGHVSLWLTEATGVEVVDLDSRHVEMELSPKLAYELTTSGLVVVACSLAGDTYLAADKVIESELHPLRTVEPSDLTEEAVEADVLEWLRRFVTTGPFAEEPTQ